MFRFDDIINKPKDSSDQPKPADNQAIPDKDLNQKKKDAIEISSMLEAKQNDFNPENVKAIYQQLYSLAGRVYRQNGADNNADFLPELRGALKKVELGLMSAGGQFMQLCLVDYRALDNFLLNHVVNVTLFSMELGIGMNLDPGELSDLGQGAFFHDLGMARYLDLINKPEKFTLEDQRVIRAHPSQGASDLETLFPGISPKITEVARQEHERLDGTGYPGGLKADAICVFARIVGLSDIYEAMMHRRPYRPRHTPLEVINAILNGKNAFDNRVIKSLIERIGIFPQGIMVRLNTRETAVVVKQNLALPLRPIVNILTDSNGKELKEPKQTDLSENAVIYIEECCEPLDRP